jgi:hypothetical protein
MTTNAVVLPRLRTDLKTAMQKKDQARLSVLRGLLAEITNASKTDKPIANDSSLFLLLRKKLAAGEDSVQEFQKAKREDLVAKEEEQIKVLREYIGGIDVFSGEELRKTVEGVVEESKNAGEKAHPGKVMGTVLKALGERAVDREELSKVIGEILGENKN